MMKAILFICLFLTTTAFAQALPTVYSDSTGSTYVYVKKNALKAYRVCVSVVGETDSTVQFRYVLVDSLGYGVKDRVIELNGGFYESYMEHGVPFCYECVLNREILKEEK